MAHEEGRSRVNPVPLSIEDEEKSQHTDMENGSFGSHSFTSLYNVDAKFEKRTLRKIDGRLLPILGLLYTACYIDRANISVARISGLDEDLDLKVGMRASIALLVFFVGYVIAEIPSNILVRRFGPANWISFITIGWGALTIGQGFVNDWISFSVLRAILGTFEAGLFPSFVYLIGSWYPRYQLQSRLSIFYGSAIGLSAFGPILAYGIIQIARYTPSYAGWRWIYIVEGAVTVLLGVLAWFLVVDFPDSRRTKFLDDEQKAWALKQLADDRGDETEQKTEVTWSVIWETCKDWKIWCFSFIYFQAAVGGYGFALFLPIILEESLNFTQERSFLLSTPPTIFGVAVSITISYISDHTHIRGPYVFALCFPAIIGLCMITYLQNSWARYVGAFVGLAGYLSMAPAMLAWQANNIRGIAKKSVATAIIIMASGVSGIYTSLVFRQQDAPKYVPGIIACLALTAVSLVLAPIITFVLWRHNKQAESGKRVLEGLASFRYTL